MTINVWSNFSKRINSTKQPTGGTQKTVYLKEEADIESPTFILDSLDFSINYVEAFGHYYFAHCRNLDGHRTEIICDIDLMATYKTNIGATSAFVEYAASSSDVTIQDPRNNVTGLIDVAGTTFSWNNNNFSSSGTFIIAVLNDDSNGTGGPLCYYALEKASFVEFSRILYDQNFITTIQNQFNSVQDCLISCLWIPVKYTNIAGSVGNIKIGRVNLTDGGNIAQGKKVSSRVISDTTGLQTITYPTYGGGSGNAMNYLDLPPYSTGELYLPFVGFVPVAMELCAFTKSITVESYIDLFTGDIVYQVRYGGALVETYNGNIATKMPVSSASYDGVGVASGALTAIGGAVGLVATMASGGSALAALGAASAIAGGAGVAAKSAEFHGMVNGNTSSVIGAYLSMVPLAVISQRIPAETSLTAFKAPQGMPYFKVATLSGLSGFIKCSNASVSCAANEAEKQTINGYLNSGFYLE